MCRNFKSNHWYQNTYVQISWDNPLMSKLWQKITAKSVFPVCICFDYKTSPDELILISTEAPFIYCILGCDVGTSTWVLWIFVGFWLDCMKKKKYRRARKRFHLSCSQILERLWGSLTTLHFQRCGAVTIGCFTPIGNKQWSPSFSDE
jgi:hypothetical protein